MIARARGTAAAAEGVDRSVVFRAFSPSGRKGRKSRATAAAPAAVHAAEMPPTESMAAAPAMESNAAKGLRGSTSTGLFEVEIVPEESTGGIEMSPAPVSPGSRAKALKV